MTPSGDPASPVAAVPAQRRRRRPSIGFCFGLMVLVFLFFTWIKSCDGPIPLYHTPFSRSARVICGLDVDHLGYDLLLGRIVVPSPWIGASGFVGWPSCRRSFWRPVDWVHLSLPNTVTTRIHVEHWFLIVAHLTLWSAGLAWHRRCLRKGMAAAAARVGGPGEA